ncbi:uncharacterized protein LOC125494129 [Beta vulgaris subsp. vulgaris]|uniref:uncharacterized protein LOC125494129 n=1 Tax=Beta vulgaris subsp. vulgaris TaxID=3555 RepID=UPI0020371AA3|nr:uncharacterized protein LOC125494129 [Beta vulgaris subsp. vulgaris]
MEKIKAKDKLDDEMMHKEKIARERHMTSRRNVYSMLQQKAKINWLKCGDENTNVFYQAIKARRQRQPVLAGLVNKGKRINDSHMRIINAPFTKDDVGRVIFSIPNGKPQVLMGSTTVFYKHNWEVIREEVSEAILDFFKIGKLLKFIQQMLEGVGFPSWFVQQIMTCITTPKFSIMVNESPSGFFWCSERSETGGDPMSPLLFSLGMDYLDRVLSFVGEQVEFIFHVKCKNIKLSHLCFADDLLLLCNGDFRSIYTLLQGFQMFSNASGLEVNRAKSEVSYAGMTTHEIQRVTDVSGFQFGTLPFRYLGVPISTTKLKARDCQKMIEKMVFRIRTWSTRHLSFAARCQLVNSVLMSINVY